MVGGEWKTMRTGTDRAPHAESLTRATGGDQLPGPLLVRTLSVGGSPYAGYAGPAAADAHGPAAAQQVPLNVPKAPE